MVLNLYPLKIYSGILFTQKYIQNKSEHKEFDIYSEINNFF